MDNTTSNAGYRPKIDLYFSFLAALHFPKELV